MGSDAEVFIFDHAAYSTKVVPVFLELLRGGEAADWLQPFIKKRELKPWLWETADLSQYSAALNADLSWHGQYDLRWTYGANWQEHWSNATEGSGPGHIPSADTIEQLNWLFQIAVSIQCVGASQFVGRSMTTSHYSDLLAESGLKEDDRIVGLLSALGKRGFLIGYQFGSGFEGVNGWLDPSETADLTERLDVLPLPRYETSFEAMEQFRTREWGGYEYPDFSFEALSLSFVRTVAALAAREHRGLLWGNDVMPPEFYSSA